MKNLKNYYLNIIIQTYNTNPCFETWSRLHILQTEYLKRHYEKS